MICVALVGCGCGRGVVRAVLVFGPDGSTKEGGSLCTAVILAERCGSGSGSAFGRFFLPLLPEPRSWEVTMRGSKNNLRQQEAPCMVILKLVFKLFEDYAK